MANSRKNLICLTSILSIMIIFVTLLVPTKTTYAKSTNAQVPQLSSYGLPSWWNGTTCDKVHYSAAYLISTWRGIQICGPFPGLHSTGHLEPFPSGAAQYEFQCTELVARYMYLAYGLPSPIANGNQIVDAYTVKLANSPFHKVVNDGTAHLVPVEGDVFSYAATASNSFGHTSIVTGSNVNASGNGTVTVIQQNITWNGSAYYTEQLAVNNWIIQASTHGAGSVSSWMTTRTIGAQSTVLSLSVTMPGISSKSGDNNNLKHPSRNATVWIRDANNNVVETISTFVVYSQSTGVYSDIVNIGTLSAGGYTVSIKLSNALSKQYPGFFSTPTGTVNEPTLALISGDINGDNVLDTQDYNDLLSCYGSKFSKCAFNPSADLNDDGVVDGVDYNIFLKDMQTQHGG